MSAYAYGMRFDDDSNAITVIDEENQTAATTGYINGEPVDFSGGGGSSDFSTAEVTVTLGTSGNFLYLANAVDVEGEECSAYDIEQSGVFNAILYKGYAIAKASNVTSISGNIESIGDELYLITGNCTITIS